MVGHYHSLAISTNGKLYGWGANKENILGTGGMDDNKNKKDYTKLIYYFPVELRANKNLNV